MPLRMDRRSRAAKPPSNPRPESSLPSPVRFLGILEASFGKQFFHIAEAERIPTVQPDSMPHDGRRKVTMTEPFQVGQTTEAAGMARLFSEPDIHEGVAALMSKRKPVFDA